MALSYDQWATVTNIIIWERASGLGPDEAAWAVNDQLGSGVWTEVSRAWPYIFTQIGVDYDAGYANNEVAARAQTQWGPVLNPPAPINTGPGSELSGNLTSQQRSAKASLDNFLSQYGLQSLGDYVWQEYLNNIPIEQIMLDIRGRPEYIARFPAMQDLQRKGRAISEAEYIAYEKAVAGLAQAAGLPDNFFDQPGDFKDLIAGEVSVNEVGQRIQDYLDFAETAPADQRASLERLYGVTTGGVAAYFMDPERALPLLEKQANAALTSVSAERAGYGQLSQGEAEYVAGLGIDPRQAGQGFSQLAGISQLFNPLDAGEQAISREQQLFAMFGQQAESKALIEQRASRRAAQFQAGGGFSTGKEGIAGIGAAR